MANYDENPFAGDSENPFAVSICGANKLIRGGIYDLFPLVWSCTFLLEAKLQFTVRWGISFVFQDPSVASHTTNAARGLEDFNPFADQNTSKAGSAAKVVLIYSLCF